MSNYTKTTDFEAKDSLPTGDSGKIIRGAEFETEFDAISTAIATKADTAGPTFTGTLTFETISDGTIGVTAFVDEDNMASNSATLVPTQQSVKAYVDSQVGANNELSEILANGNTTGGTNIVFGDSASVSDDRLVFGAGSDLQIYHSGVHSYIDDAGTGNLTLRGNASVRVEKYEGEILADFAADGAVSLYHDNSVKIATTSTGVSVTGNVAVSGTVDGRDVATDGSKLDGIEAGATGDQTNAEIRAAVEAATDSNVFTDADHSKLDGIEAGADVTDTANVTAAGALMDSELTSIASVKALNQGVATTDSPTFAAVTVNGNVEFDGLSGTGSVTVTDILDQDNMSSNSATALATQQSIKAYVDSQVATVDTLSEVLANGNTTGGTDIAVGTGDDITFADSSKAIFGAGSDLQIYHNGSHSFLSDQGTGNMLVLADNFEVNNSANNENKIVATTNGAVTLFYDNAAKIATTSTGIDVTGSVAADGLTVGDTSSAFSAIYITSSTTGESELRLGDTDTDAGSVSYTNSDDTMTFRAAAGARMSLDSSGLDVTGTVTADGLTVNGNATIQKDDALVFIKETDGTNIAAVGDLTGAGQGGAFYYDHGGTATIQLKSYEASTIENGLNVKGDISFYESTGTTPKFFWDASAESLGIGTSSPGTKLSVVDTSAQAVQLSLQNSGRDWRIGPNSGVGSSSLVFYDNTASQTRLVIDSSGNVGIGTSSPETNLHIEDSSSFSIIRLVASTTENAGIDFGDPDDRDIGRVRYNNSDNSMVFHTNAAEQMRIDSDGNLGISTSSPATGTHSSYRNLVIGETTSATSGLSFKASTTGQSAIFFSDGASPFNRGQVLYDHSSDHLAFASAGSERMRLNYNGHLLIGTTDAGIYDDATDEGGHNLLANGQYFNSTASEINMILNRQNSDGDIIQFRKDGSTVGSIGTIGGDVYFGSSSGSGSALRFDGANNLIYASNASGSARDAALDLGSSSVRFKDLYLSGGITLGTNSRIQDTGGLFIGGSTATIFEIGAGSEKMRLTSTGLGIGTSSPQQKAHIASGGLQITGNISSPASGQTGVLIDYFSDGARFWSRGTASARGTFSFIQLENDGGSQQTAMLIDASGNVGIGTSSPARKLHVVGTSRPALIGSDNAVNYLKLYNSATGSSTYNGLDLLVNSTSDSQINTYGMPLTFGTSASNGTNVTERMRIDTSGNLLVGTTSESTWESAAGFRTRNSGSTTITRDGNPPLYVNRLTSDGTIVQFQKGTTTVGSIATVASNMYLGTGDTGLYFNAGDDTVMPINVSTASGRDAGIDLGKSNTRWKDLYLSGGAYLGGTGSANKLDDYEEGTWTPTVSSGITSPAYDVQTASYTKIGNRVIFSMYIRLSGGTVNSSQLIFSGLPFSASGNTGSGSIGFSNSNFRSTNVPTNFFPSGTTIECYEAGGTTLLGTELGTATFDLRMSGVYLTTA